MTDVYESLKNRAASGRFILTDIKRKINTMWTEDELTDDQRTELLSLAETNHNPSFSPMSPTEIALLERIEDLETTLAQITSTETEVSTL